MVEPDSIVLEQLRAIRGEIGKLAGEMRTMRVELTAVRQHMAGMLTIQEHDHTDICGNQQSPGSDREASRIGRLRPRTSI